MKGQFKIQQMAFMILAVFVFFVLVGLFLLNFKAGDIRQDAQNMLKEQALASLKSISNMPELGCGSSEEYCVDEDKLMVMTGNASRAYEAFWPVSSVEVYKVYPAFEEVIDCPNVGCNHYEVYDSRQNDSVKYSAYVLICKKVKEGGYVYDKCDIGKMLLGVKNVKE